MRHLLLLLVAALPKLLHAQHDDIVVAERPSAADNVELNARFQVAQQQVAFQERQQLALQARKQQVVVDQWVFGGQSPNFGTQVLEADLKERIDTLLQYAATTQDQRAKLEVAGWIDIQRFLERVEQLKRKLQESTSDVNNLNALQVQAIALSASYKAGLFGDESFFAKTASRMFTREQLDRAERGRAAIQHRAHLQRAVALLKDAAKLSDQQADALMTLLLAETRPPRQPGVNTYAVAMFDMKRLPEEKLRPLFDNQQWDLFNRQFEQVKWLGPYLKQNGMLHEPLPANSVNR